MYIERLAVVFLESLAPFFYFYFTVLDIFCFVFLDFCSTGKLLDLASFIFNNFNPSEDLDRFQQEINNNDDDSTKQNEEASEESCAETQTYHSEIVVQDADEMVFFFQKNILKNIRLRHQKCQ